MQTTTAPTQFGRRTPGAATSARRGAPSYAAAVALDSATQWNRRREPTMESLTAGPSTPDAWAPTTTRAAVVTPADKSGFLDLLFSAEGRMRRRDYWVIGSVSLIVFLALAVGLAVSLPPTQALIAVLPAALIYMRIRSCVKIKRWHDRGKSAAWSLIGLIPMFGSLWAFVECGFLDGTDGPNAYGPPPK